MIRSIVAEACCTSPFGPYTTRIDSTRGGRVRLEQLSDRGRFLAVVNGPEAWSIDEDGTVEPGDAALRRAVLNHDFHLLALEQHRLERPVREDGRLVGFDSPDSRDETQLVRVRFAAWRDVESACLPAVVVISSVDGEFVLDFHRIDADAVDERVFERPY